MKFEGSNTKKPMKLGYLVKRRWLAGGSTNSPDPPLVPPVVTAPSPSVILTFILLLFFFFVHHSEAWCPSPNQKNITDVEPKGYKTNVTYHMGPILTSSITFHIIWYGTWPITHKQIIREFLESISAPEIQSPSVSDWWKTVELYTDRNGFNITGTIRLGKESHDPFMSQGKNLTSLSIQTVIKTAINAKTEPLPADPTGAIYLVLTDDDVHVEDFCVICGFRNLTYPSIVGYTLFYVFIGNSAKLCPDVCAYPFAVPDVIPGLKPVKSPNGDVGIDGMISVLGRQIVNLVTNPLYNSWYDDQDPPFQLEVADVCEGVYGPGSRGNYIGKVFYGVDGGAYNVHGVRRRFMVPWFWNYVMQQCDGPNAVG